ncbi:hypothetical protein BHE74_00027767 [Ensete ventricosum]|uniref:Uncharacterized protein n=1 Tax=Ensete ventricosum TaxID=4639 RepID=A0A444E5Y5_ENSVE|nr:hypothetical protein B296_00015185 [Ensete ventricosum]RWW05809.1 hypothetical protein GW17_00030898 [Ensete ventricosum]RWW64951.1 hypothetical protein BHE74_00027767 [Ensete ventricosum]
MGGKASSVGWSLHCHGSTNMPCGLLMDYCKCHQLFITLNMIQQKQVYPSVVIQ